MPHAESAVRLFLAVPLPEEIRRELAEHLRTRGRSTLPGRRVLPESWHLTLRFLGETPPDVLRDLTRKLAHAPLGPPFRLRFGSYGAFLRPSRAKVLWLGIADGVEPLTALATRVETVARAAGFAPEHRPFAPHLTLSRLRNPEDVRPVLQSLPPFDRAMRVSEVVLYRSHLGQGPARYEPLRSFTLE